MIPAIGSFGANARLYLGYAFLSGLGSGLWAVAFNLYLLASGFDPAFVGLVAAAELASHGLMAFPAGVIGDAAGRKRSFILASLLKILVAGILLVTTRDLALVGLAILVGLSDSFHGVVGAPFMMENSSPRERVHLFTASALLGTIAVVGGALVAGTMSSLLSGQGLGFTGFGDVHGDHVHVGGVEGVVLSAAPAMRATLLLTLPLNLLALVPLAFMRDRRVEIPGGPAAMLLLRHVTSRRVVAQMFVATLLFGVGGGLFYPLINVYFATAHGTTEQDYGTLFAAGSALAAVGLFAVPWLARRVGRVDAVFWTRFSVVPLLVGFALRPSFEMAVALYLVRAVLVQVSYPLASMFSMEVVRPPERATTAGLLHAATDLPVGLAAAYAGALLAGKSYLLLFGLAATFTLAGAVLWRVFLRPVERAVDVPVGADPPPATPVPAGRAR